jgi:hypothetical protein
MDGKETSEAPYSNRFNIVLIAARKLLERFQAVLRPLPVVKWRFRRFDLTV